MTALQRLCETTRAVRSLFQRYCAPQKRPAARAARMSMGFSEKTWTPE